MDAGPEGWLATHWEIVQARLIDAWTRVREGGWPSIRVLLAAGLAATATAIADRSSLSLGILGILAVAFLFRRLRRYWSGGSRAVARRQSPKLVPAELRAILRDTESRWAKAGWRRPATKGLREHLESLPADALSPDVRQLSSRVVLLYYQARFGAEGLTEQQLSDLRALQARL